KRMVRDGERKEVILPTAHGALPDNPDAPRGQITARVLPWDENFIFWTMDIGRETCIVKPVGRVGSRAAYRRWLGVGMTGIRDGFGQTNMAFTIPPSVSPAVSVENDRADPENERADLKNDLADLASESDDSSVITITEIPNTSPCQNSLIDALNRKRTRATSRGEIPTASHGSVSLEHAIERMLENDPSVDAYLVGKNGKETGEIVTIRKFEWKSDEIYWLAKIRNEQQVLAKLPGGRNGSRFFKWRGHAMGVDSSRVVAVPLSEAEIKEMTPENTASTGQARVSSNEAPHDDSISSDKGRCLPKGFRPAFSARPTPTFRKPPAHNSTSPTFKEAKVNTNEPRATSISGTRKISDNVEDDSTLERPSKRSKRMSATRQFNGSATTKDLPVSSSHHENVSEPSIVGKEKVKESQSESIDATILESPPTAGQEEHTQPNHDLHSTRHQKDRSHAGIPATNVETKDAYITVGNQFYPTTFHR
ncbi:MAG: hypothetical protein Q9184_007708, partial [Pyrenodesmia sp. 2 TL-2023]